MAVITSKLTPTHSHKLRPFDPRRDLEPVADLIEFSFSSTLDPDGRRYLHQMRSAAQRKGINRWSSFASSSRVLPIVGFVWEEAGKVVGNLSLVPFFYQGRRVDLIANVAVYPEYRRQGIARALTAAALEKSKRRIASATWLQVRHDNQAATELYSGLGFERRACRTTWVASPDSLQGEVSHGFRVTFRRPRHWTQQRIWLDKNYPVSLRWHFRLKMAAMKPGLWASINRFLNEVDIYHWAVDREGELLGVLSWQKSNGYADHLWLGAPIQNEDWVLQTVLPFIRQEGRLNRPISLDIDEGRAVDPLLSAGFKPKATLIWMEVKHHRNTQV